MRKYNSFRFSIISLILLISTSAIASTNIYNVRDFGATGLKSDNATLAIQKAIDLANTAGGGVVLVPSGDYPCLPLILYSNITLQLEAGAIIYVDLPNPDFKGRALIYAENAKNITIRGKGKIDGQAKYVWEDFKNDDVEIAKEVELARAAGVEMKRSYRTGKAAFTLLLKECEDITIEDITIVNTSLWCMRIWGCNKLNIRNVNISSDLLMGVNSDGIDLDGTSNVHITGCNISTGDDAICIKSGTWKWDATGKIHQSENIVVDNCILTSSSTALMIGTETFGDIHHIAFNNCVIRNSNKGFGINVQDGATVSDVIVSNLTMELSRRHWNWWGSAQAFYLVLKKRNPDSKEGTIRDILITNIIAHVQGTSSIETTIDKPLENITISNMKIYMEAEATPDKRTSNVFKFYGVDQLKVKDIDIYWAEDKKEPKWQSSILMENITNFEMRAISARQAYENSDFPSISLKNCKNGRVYNCFAQNNTHTFFHISGENTSNLIFTSNFLNNAVKPFEISKEVIKKSVVIQ